MSQGRFDLGFHLVCMLAPTSIIDGSRARDEDRHTSRGTHGRRTRECRAVAEGRWLFAVGTMPSYRIAPPRDRNQVQGTQCVISRREYADPGAGWESAF